MGVALSTEFAGAPPAQVVDTHLEDAQGRRAIKSTEAGRVGLLDARPRRVVLHETKLPVQKREHERRHRAPRLPLGKDDVA